MGFTSQDLGKRGAEGLDVYLVSKVASVAPRPFSRKFKTARHTLPPLPYGYDALEPWIDERTLRLHHVKHHQRYVDGLNAAEEKLEMARVGGDFAVVRHLERARGCA